MSTEERPKDMAVILRQLGTFTTVGGVYPMWLHREMMAHPESAWTDILNQAADEFEGMQKLNGRLLRRLAGD